MKSILNTQHYRQLSKALVAAAMIGAGMSAHAVSVTAPHLFEPNGNPDVTTSTDVPADDSVGELTPASRQQILAEAQRGLHRLNVDIKKQLEDAEALTPELRAQLAAADRDGRAALNRELQILALHDADLDPSQYFPVGVLISWGLGPQVNLPANLQGSGKLEVGFALTLAMNNGMPNGIRIAGLGLASANLTVKGTPTQLASMIPFLGKYPPRIQVVFTHRNVDGYAIGNLQDVSGLYLGVGAEWQGKQLPAGTNSSLAAAVQSKKYGSNFYFKVPNLFTNRLGELTSFNLLGRWPQVYIWEPTVGARDFVAPLGNKYLPDAVSARVQWLQFGLDNDGFGSGFDLYK